MLAFSRGKQHENGLLQILFWSVQLDWSTVVSPIEPAALLFNLMFLTEHDHENSPILIAAFYFVTLFDKIEPATQSYLTF